MSGGWAYWDQERHSWVPATAPEIAERWRTRGTQFVTWQFSLASPGVDDQTRLNDYSNAPDPDGVICRPCKDGHHPECEGSAKKCRCQLCPILTDLAELNEEWDLIERWGL